MSETDTLSSDIKMPLVNILIPTYKRHDLLRCLIEDIKEQTYKNIKVWVCSDGPDKIVENIVKKSGTNSSIPFVYIPLPKHAGCWGGPARRYAVKKIDNDGLICIIDDDNTIYPNYIDIMQSKIRKDVGLSCCNIICKNDDNPNGIVIPDDADIFKICHIDPLCIMTRMDIARTCIDYWGDEYSGDYFFIEACAKMTDCKYINKILAEHRWAKH